MGLGALFERIAQTINAEYDRRIRAASNVTEYGAGHGHGHEAVTVVEASPGVAHTVAAVGDAGYTPGVAPETEVVPPVHG